MIFLKKLYIDSYFYLYCGITQKVNVNMCTVVDYLTKNVYNRHKSYAIFSTKILRDFHLHHTDCAFIYYNQLLWLLHVHNSYIVCLRENVERVIAA